MLRRLYQWTLSLSAKPGATWALAAVSFAESSVFLIPPDVMLIPMCLADRTKAWFYATICTIASVLGGIAGYAIGYFLYETVGEWIVATYGLESGFNHFAVLFQQYGGWVVLIKGLTPIPYKLVTIASGVFSLNMGIFIAASIISRGARFFLLAALLHHYGEPMKAFIEKYLEWVSLALLALVVGGFLLLKYF